MHIYTHFNLSRCECVLSACRCGQQILFSAPHTNKDVLFKCVLLFVGDAEFSCVCGGSPAVAYTVCCISAAYRKVSFPA